MAGGGHASLVPLAALRKLHGLLWLRSLKKAPLRSAITLSCVALGTGLFVAVDLSGRAAHQSLQRSMDVVAGKARLVVSGDAGDLPASCLPLIAQLEGVQLPIPQIVGSTRLDGDVPEPLEVVGVDFALEGISRNHRIAQLEFLGGDPAVMLELSSIALTHSFASRHGLELGDSLRLSTVEGPREFRVAARLQPVGVARARGDGVVLMSLPAAQHWLGRTGRFDRVEVLLTPEADVERIRDRLAGILSKTLGPGVAQVQRPRARAEALEESVAAYRTTLSLLATLALFAGLLVVASSIGFHVEVQRPRFAVVRMLGGARRALLGGVLLDGALTGLFGGGIGVLAGWGLAGLLAGNVEQSILSQFGEAVHLGNLRDLAPTPAYFVSVVAATVLACVLVAVPAARRAAAVPPMESRRLPVGASPPLVGNRASLILGTVCLGLVLLAAALHLSVGRPPVRFTVALLAILSVALLAPPIVCWFASVMQGAWRRTRSPLAWVAGRRVRRTPGRTATLARLITTALGLVFVLGVIRTSVERSIANHLRETFSADLVVGTPSSLGRGADRSMDAGLRDQIEAVEGVQAGIVGERLLQTRFRDEPMLLLGSEAREFASAGESPEAWVSRTFADRFAVREGTKVTLQTEAGTLAVLVRGILDLPTRPLPTLVLERRWLEQHWGDGRVDCFRIHLTPGHEASEVLGRLRRELQPHGPLAITREEELRRQIEAAVHQGFAFVDAIEVLLLALAAAGVVLGSWLGGSERRRGARTLRRLGVTRAQGRRMALEEHLWIGLACSVLALCLGGVVGSAWTHWTLADALGWTVSVHPPLGPALLVLILGPLMGALAGVLAAASLERGTAAGESIRSS